MCSGDEGSPTSGYSEKRAQEKKRATLVPGICSLHAHPITSRTKGDFDAVSEASSDFCQASSGGFAGTF